MDFQELKNRLEELCPGAVLEAVPLPEEPTPTGPKDPFVVVDRDRIAEVITALRDDESFRFTLLADLTAVEYPDQVLKPKKGETEGKRIPGRFEVLYRLRSVVHNLEVLVKIKLPHDDEPSVPTICELLPAANWHEREAWDLMGVKFEGHPDPRRILCCEDWVGHPLRKDYVFPKEYHGISAE